MAATAQHLLDAAWDGADMASVYPNPLQEAEMRRRAHAMLADYATWTTHAGADVAEVVVGRELTENKALQAPGGVANVGDDHVLAGGADRY